MGTIAQKLEYLNDTRLLLKDNINKINSVLDDNSTFRSYPQELFNGYLDILNNGTDTLWNNLEKVSASGEEATLENVETAPIKMVLNGNTSQDGTPSPDYPQEVKVVKGENVVSVQGKNLFPINNIDLTLSGIRLYTQDGSFIANGTATSNVYDTNSNYKNNISFNLKKGTYTLSLNATEPHQITLKNKTTGDILARVNGGTILNATFTLEEDAEVYLGFYFAKDVPFDNVEYKIQLEEGSTATPYVPYSHTDYPINLGTLGLCKIRTYQDYLYKNNGKWYVHKAINKVVLNGSENWSLQSVNDYGIANFKLGIVDYIPNKDNYSLCDKFSPQTSLIAVTKTIGYFLNVSRALFIRADSTIANTLADFKTWLSNNNVTLYYVLATPTEEEITNTTLIEQLEAIAKAKSVKDKTYITQTNEDLPFILDVEAIKEYEVN